MMEHGTFIALAYGFSAIGLVFMAVKSYSDMKKTDRQAKDLRRARKNREGA